LQNFDLHLHKNAFGDLAPPGLAEVTYSTPRLSRWILGVGAGKEERKGGDENGSVY